MSRYANWSKVEVYIRCLPITLEIVYYVMNNYCCMIVSIFTSKKSVAPMITDSALTLKFHFRSLNVM